MVSKQLTFLMFLNKPWETSKFQCPYNRPQIDISSDLCLSKLQRYARLTLFRILISSEVFIQTSFPLQDLKLVLEQFTILSKLGSTNLSTGSSPWGTQTHQVPWTKSENPKKFQSITSSRQCSLALLRISYQQIQRPVEYRTIVLNIWLNRDRT